MVDKARPFRPSVNSMSLLTQAHPGLRAGRGSSSTSPVSSRSPGSRPTSATSALTGRTVPLAAVSQSRQASNAIGSLRYLPTSGLGAGGLRMGQQGALALASVPGGSNCEAAPASSGNVRPGSARAERLTPISGAAGVKEGRGPPEVLSTKDSGLSVIGPAPSPSETHAGSSGASRTPSARGSTAGPSSSRPPTSARAVHKKPEDLIVIHVRDDQRRISRDFYCSRELLLAHMHYFQSYLSGDRRHEEIDISVHCDVHIFEWLMEFIHEPETPPQLDPSSVVSILISADFLQMHELVPVCLTYLKQNASEVVKLPIDMGCLNDELVASLAHIFEAEDIERMRDKKDRLAPRLYDKKIDAMLENENELLFRCAYCHKHFTEDQREWECCPKAPVIVDFHGNAIAEHVANRSWSMGLWVAQSRKAKNYVARDLFWRIWSLTHFLNCSECGLPFPLAEMEHCTYHPQQPKFGDGDGCGIYPCCGQPAVRFDLSAGIRRGCRAKRHTPDVRSRALGSGASAQARLVDVALSLGDLVLIPFDARGHDDAEAHRRARGGTEDRLSDGGSDSDDEPIALKPVKAARRGGTERKKRANDDTDSSDQSSSSDSDSDASSSDSDVDSDSHSDVAPSSPSTANRMSRCTGRAESLKPSVASHGGGGPSGVRGSAAAKGGSSWKVDIQQQDDSKRLAQLSRALESCRQDEGPVCKDGPSGEKAPSLAGPKAFFLDRRYIMLITRNGAVSVVWPRSSTAVAAKRRPPNTSANATR